jgi:hypothetical protein
MEDRMRWGVLEGRGMKGDVALFGDPDFVTSVAFHPQDAQRFVSGGCGWAGVCSIEEWVGRLWLSRAC